jgi:hypothetical protein
MRKLATFASLIALTATAAAQNVVATGETAQPPLPRLVDARLGVLLGDAQVGDTNSFSPGLSAGVGYRIGDLTLRALFDYYRVGDAPGDTDMARRGRALRVGGAARYSFAHTDNDSAAQVDFWGELGGGYEHVAWLAGGVLDRPSAEAAFGIDAGRRGDRDRDGKRKQIGYYMAFRTLIAEAPEMPGAIATCGGPCSQATKPPRTDVTMFFDMGVHWGR